MYAVNVSRVTTLTATINAPLIVTNLFIALNVLLLINVLLVKKVIFFLLTKFVFLNVTLKNALNVAIQINVPHVKTGIKLRMVNKALFVNQVARSKIAKNVISQIIVLNQQ